MIELSDIRAEALHLLEGVAEGNPLDALTVELIAFAVRISVTSLDEVGASVHAKRALELGAHKNQLHEVALLVSGLGVHSLFVGTRLVERMSGHHSPRELLDTERQQLWDQWVGSDRFWKGFEAEVPGFLRDLLQASPAGFDAFFRYCAVPWKNPQLDAVSKELMSMATDATPTHRFMPGMRLHLRNALKLGAGRTAILQTLDIAALAPAHTGVG
jgi:alkylhydroperoxidase/carboxymuconolactone decarboxylase family protein YurZ